MELRNYKDADFPQLEELLKNTKIYYAPLDKREIFKKKIKHDPESIIVAADDDQLVGTVFIIYDPRNSFIYHLCVHSNHRGQGYAKELMNEAEKRLKARGVNRPTLFVEEENRQVVDFYRKRGWNILYKVFCMEKQL
ncbi:GNAT family N-acetyltransferase [Candidatus Peregrinibacteria bacterium]|nr:GNAT family N-acetyltransferase [Candidatus Peregrinibacteria bacterium]